MNTLEPFELAGTPLRKGSTLIEAGAGTGKTFTIAGIILRLVLEEGIDIGRILAVTYTVAATAELRDRVRKRLRAALEDLRNGKSDDEIIARFLAGASGDALRNGIAGLDNAVQNFDEARIFTIHGFCQRVLAENAFESGAFFDMEMLSEAGPVLEEMARDFWRRQFYPAPPLFPSLAIARKISHAHWARLLENIRNHPDLRILPPAAEESSADIGGKLTAKLDEVAKEWNRNKGGIAGILSEHESLSRDEKKFRRDTVQRTLQLLKELEGDIKAAPPELLNAIIGLSNRAIAGKLRNNRQPPAHRFFDLCEDFENLSRDYFNQLTHEFLAFTRREMPARMERLNSVTYADLLTRVRDALAGPAGAAFAAMLGGRYRAALIDEFQDTDPIQYGIFHRIFGGGEHFLYFIGDPRQAIYSFRGADIFTYQEAAAEVSGAFTLDTNWRSEKRLLHAVNLLFEMHPSLGGGIRYHEVHAPDHPLPGFEELSGGEGEARLRFRYLPVGEEGGEFSQAKAELLIRAAVVADIARLKASGARLGMRELRFGDMAVLAPTNLLAAKLQELLRERGIKSVLQTEKSVFETDEARELQLLMDAVIGPGRAFALNTALTTMLVDLQPDDVGLQEEGGQRQKRLEQFFGWRDLWESSGFMAMFRRLLVEERVRERLVRLPGGERKLANLLHLAELLHRAAAEQRLTPEGTRLWLVHEMRSGASAEERQLRLESDDDAVLIATIHKSKGLEYPVVFCPYLWKPGDRASRTEILFHDVDAGKKITLDLRDKSEAPEHDAATGRERFEESLRMMYVAVTRARNLCYIYAGDIKGFDHSPLAHVIGGEHARPSLEMLAERSDGDIAFNFIDPGADERAGPPPPGDEAAGEIRARAFRGSIAQHRMITSFSALIENESEDTGPDELEIDDPDPGENATFAALARFDRGVRTGLFWHELLQELDFQAARSVSSLVAAKLASHGFGTTQVETVTAQVRNLLSAPLEGDLTLERISMSARISEVEFSFPIVPFDPGKLRAVFAGSGGAADYSGQLGRLNFRPSEGFMRGFIDLLFRFESRFYIVDWKSNWLGNRREDYDEPNLAASIRRHYYFLQYHLYTVAADLFLRHRMPGYNYGEHFGGVFYIFLRGVDPAVPGRGVFRDRPDASLIRVLRETLTGGAR